MDCTQQWHGRVAANAPINKKMDEMGRSAPALRHRRKLEGSGPKPDRLGKHRGCLYRVVRKTGRLSEYGVLPFCACYFSSCVAVLSLVDLRQDLPYLTRFI